MGSFGLGRSRGRISHAKALTACTGAALLAGGAMAVGAIPSSSGTINACYSKKSGAMRIVDTKEKCGKKETRLTWNEKGVKGDAGATGAAGAQGPMGPTGPGSSALTGTPGSAGAKGPPAQRGPPGRRGRRGGGLQGEKGDTGDAGANGANGAAAPRALPEWPVLRV